MQVIVQVGEGQILKIFQNPETAGALTHKNGGSNGGFWEGRIIQWQETEQTAAAGVYAQVTSRCRQRRNYSMAWRCG